MKRSAEPSPTRSVRCAIYTRKSTEEGLEREFNSLDAQRESAEAYIASQKGEGWVCLPDRYDDGGFTGGNIERPALRRLMADIEAGRVDCVVLYKVDRLSRSLMDFARLMEVFERKSVSFVSVTQAFNTTLSMGRLTLNILLSFAQFEREIISERTRDKIAAARRKGKWSGGRSILGYDVDPTARKLVVNPQEAALVREIFAAYAGGRSLLEVARDLNGRGLRTKLVHTRKGEAYGGRDWDKVAVLKILTNLLYLGRVRYKDETHPGEHEAIIDQASWDKVQQKLRFNGRTGGMHARNRHGALLKSLVRCAACDAAMGHAFASTKGGTRIHRYYVCHKAQKQGWDACPSGSLPAEQIEAFVVEQIRRIGTDPRLRSLTLAQLREQADAARVAAEGELDVVREELKRVKSDLKRAAAGAAKSPQAASRLADLHARAHALEEQGLDLERIAREANDAAITKDEVDAALAEFNGVWESLSPNERARLLRALIQRIDYDGPKGSISIRFHPLGLRSLGCGAVEEVAA